MGQAGVVIRWANDAQYYAQLMDEGDIDGTQLLPWQQLHQGSVAALDICTETREVLLYHISSRSACCSLLSLLQRCSTSFLDLSETFWHQNSA